MSPRKSADWGGVEAQRVTVLTRSRGEGAEAPAEGEAGPADGGAGGTAEGSAGGGGYSAEPGAAEWRRARGMPGFDLRPEAAPAPAPAAGGGAGATGAAAASEEAAAGPYRREGTPHPHSAEPPPSLPPVQVL